jgi:hypothetical protein
MSWFHKVGATEREANTLRELEKAALGVENEDKLRQEMFAEQIKELEFLRRNIQEIEEFLKHAKPGMGSFINANFPKIHERIEYIKKAIEAIKAKEAVEGSKELTFVMRLQTLVNNAERGLEEIKKENKWF